MRTRRWTMLATALTLTTTGCALGGTSAPQEAFTIVPAEEEPAQVEPRPDEGGAAPSLTLAALTESWGCGNGWAVSNPDQTVGLVIHPRGGDDPVPTASDVGPDGYWAVELRFGRDLFANWCDDVIEPGEPEPVIDRTLTGTAGTLTLDGVPADRFACPQTLTVEVTDLVVAEGGSSVVLGDGAITNDSWGCFAG